MYQYRDFLCICTKPLVFPVAPANPLIFSKLLKYQFCVHKLKKCEIYISSFFLISFFSFNPNVSWKFRVSTTSLWLTSKLLYKWPGNTHCEALTAGLGHGDRAIQPGWTLETSLLPHFLLTTRGFSQNSQNILIVCPIHVVFKLNTDLSGRWGDGRAPQTSTLSISHIVTLMIDVESLCRKNDTEERYFYSDLDFKLSVCILKLLFNLILHNHGKNKEKYFK